MGGTTAAAYKYSVYSINESGDEELKKVLNKRKNIIYASVFLATTLSLYILNGKMGLPKLSAIEALGYGVLGSFVSSYTLCKENKEFKRHRKLNLHGDHWKIYGTTDQKSQEVGSGELQKIGVNSGVNAAIIGAVFIAAQTFAKFAGKTSYPYSGLLSFSALLASSYFITRLSTSLLVSNKRDFELKLLSLVVGVVAAYIFTPRASGFLFNNPVEIPRQLQITPASILRILILNKK